MASGAVLVAYQKLYRKASEDIEAFRRHEARLLSLFRTLSNVVRRLPALQDRRNFKCVADVSGFVGKVACAQAVALEDVFIAIRRCCGELNDAASRLREIAAQGDQIIKRERRLSAAACLLSNGPIPSIDACRQGLHMIGDSHTRQAKLRQAIASQLGVSTPAADWADIMACAEASLCVDQTAVAELVYVMEQTEERPHM